MLRSSWPRCSKHWPSMAASRRATNGDPQRIFANLDRRNRVLDPFVTLFVDVALSPEWQRVDVALGSLIHHRAQLTRYGSTAEIGLDEVTAGARGGPARAGSAGFRARENYA